MLTNQRRCEIVAACDGLINSSNINEKGKFEAKIKRDEMIQHLVIYGDTHKQTKY